MKKAESSSRTVVRRWHGQQSNDTVDFKALAQQCLRGLESMDIATDQLHQLRNALKEVPLPRPLMLQIMLISGRLLRASGALHPPVYELTRLVELYSQPWEEKGSVLTKLHRTFSEHHRQLQLALSQLQTTGADLERMREERLCMLWERLFAKSMSSQRHGRRWKFLIESFRQSAEKGEHIIFEDDDSDSSDSDNDESQGAVGATSASGRRRKPPLKATSRRMSRPSILVAAEKRQAERERLQQELLQLQHEISQLKHSNSELQERLDKALTKKPMASAACQVQLIKPPGSETPNEVLSAVSREMAINKSRASLSAGGDGSDADTPENVQGDVAADSAVTHVHVLDVTGFGGVLLPDVAIEAVVRPSPNSDAKESRRIRVADVVYINNTLRVCAPVELQGVFPSDTVEFRLYCGAEEPEVMAVGSTNARVLLHSINTAASSTVKGDGGQMATRTTLVSSTVAVPLRTNAAMASFAEEAGAGECPMFLNLTVAASHSPLSDKHIALMDQHRSGAPERPQRRNRVRSQLDVEEEEHRARADAMRENVDVANGLFELLDVNSDDLREATFTMQEMLELTLLHTKQLQALQKDFEERVRRVEQERDEMLKEHTTRQPEPRQSFGIQTDPIPEPEPKIIEKEVEKLVEVEKVIEKIVERVKVVERVVEVPTESGSGVRPRRRYRPAFNFDSPFLQRLVTYAQDKVRRRKELLDRVQGERDRELTAQMASRFVLDQGARPQSDTETPTDSSDDVCLPAMFMPGGETFSSKHAGAWYPLNATARRTQPPSMVSLPPVRLPPLSTTPSRQGHPRSTSPLVPPPPPTPSFQQQQQQQQQQRGDAWEEGQQASTAVAWRRMRLNNTRSSSGVARSVHSPPASELEADLPWPGRGASAPPSRE